MSDPLVSVVIPCFNYAHFVGRSIESALDQTYSNIEIIVINNGSTDNSLDVLKKYRDRVVILDQSNLGQSGARNRGIAEAKGDFIAFLDADDVWLPNKISKQITKFSNPNVGLVYSGYFITDSLLIRKCAHIPKNKGKVLHFFSNGAAAVIQGGESTAVIRTECFRQLGLFDPALSISSGFDMYRRISGRYLVEVVPEPLMLYRQHSTNASKNAKIFEKDILFALKKMFRDPAAQSVFPFKRKCYGKAYLSISGNYLHQRDFKNCLKFTLFGLLNWPPGILYVLSFPLRQISRFLSKFKKDSQCVESLV